MHQPLPLLSAHLSEDDLDVFHALDGGDGGGHVAVDPILEGTAGDREEHEDPDAAAVHLDALEHPDVLDRLPDLRIQDVSQCFADFFLGDHRQLHFGDGFRPTYYPVSDRANR